MPLKAYSYAESEYVDSGVIDKDVFAKEKQIISEFVLNNPSSNKETLCLFCGCDTNIFDMLNEVYYNRCNNCFSIFAKVEKNIIKSYKTYPPLVAYRQSKEYQESAEVRRDGIWLDFLFWLEYRLARYNRNIALFDIIDISNRYNEFSKRIKTASFCKSYNVEKSADVVLFLEQFRCIADPVETLLELKCMVKDNGVLVMNVRVGSGFDVLVLKGCSETVFPYETILLPSIEGLQIILQKTGFDILEISTPGSHDIEHVLQNKEYLSKDNHFIHYLIENTDKTILAEFQRFLQKSGMSSHARVIARKKSE